MFHVPLPIALEPIYTPDLSVSFTVFIVSDKTAYWWHMPISILYSSKTVFLLRLPERRGATTVYTFGFHPTPYNTAPGGHTQLRWDGKGNWQGDTAIWRPVARSTLRPTTCLG